MRGNLPNATMIMLYCLSLLSPETIGEKGGKAPGKMKLIALIVLDLDIVWAQLACLYHDSSNLAFS